MSVIAIQYPRSERDAVGNRVTTASFWLNPIAPFRLELTVWALRRRAVNLVDRWNGECYRRVLVMSGSTVEIAVRQHGKPETPRLQVTLSGMQMTPGAREIAAAALERLLGLKINLKPFYRFAAADSKLGPLVARFRGLKPPRFPTLFETLANAIACQQMSLSLGILLLNRLAEKFGARIETSAGTSHAFPEPAALAGQQPDAFRQLGFSHQKGRALIALAQTCVGGAVTGQDLDHLDDADVVKRLLALRGIGRWSAEYALLRGLGRLNVYPGDDVGARNNLRRWLRLRKLLDYDGVRRVTNKWQPYSGFVYFHMLLDGLENRGQLNGAIRRENREVNHDAA
jgi:DNA-3-methyladenine glycosylase II